MNRWLKRLGLAAAVTAAGLAMASCGKKTETTTTTTTTVAAKEYTVGWTIYAGWMPWPYAQESGILKKWADKYNVKINVVQINDYVESLNQFTAGKLDAVTSTNMDALTIPAAAGKDTTVLILGDYSNGNDGIVLKGGPSMAAIKGRSVNLVENSVSHYLLARGLESAGLKMSDVKVVNTSDADIVAAFVTPQVTAAVTWNPLLAEVKANKGATEVFNSSKIPMEILDTLIVSTEVAKADPNLAKALTGAWYEVMGLIAKGDPAALESMAKASGTDVAGYKAQLAATFLYTDAKAAVTATTGPEIVAANDKVRQFSFATGLFGQGAKSVDDIGIEFPGGKILGNPANVKLRFDPTYMQAAADGKL